MSPEPADAELDGEEHENIELEPGTLITQSKTYKIVGRLGEGGFGKVYKVFDPIMNRYAALKMMKMNVPEEERRRFRQEAPPVRDVHASELDPHARGRHHQGPRAVFGSRWITWRARICSGT